MSSPRKDSLTEMAYNTDLSHVSSSAAIPINPQVEVPQALMSELNQFKAKIANFQNQRGVFHDGASEGSVNLKKTIP